MDEADARCEISAIKQYWGADKMVARYASPRSRRFVWTSLVEDREDSEGGDNAEKHDDDDSDTECHNVV